MNTLPLLGFDIDKQREDFHIHLQDCPFEREHVDTLMRLAKDQAESAARHLRDAEQEMALGGLVCGKITERVNFLNTWVTMTKKPIPLSLVFASHELTEFMLTYRMVKAFLRSAGSR